MNNLMGLDDADKLVLKSKFTKMKSFLTDSKTNW